MLQVTQALPEGLTDLEVGELHAFLGGPTLLHLPGRRTPPLFVSVLLHGDEDWGWRALRSILRQSFRRPLPRALSLFIGNTAAAAEGVRYLPEQPDYNRIWTGAGAGEGPERQMARRVVDAGEPRFFFQYAQQKLGAFRPLGVQHVLQGFEPLGRLGRVAVQRLAEWFLFQILF